MTNSIQSKSVASVVSYDFSATKLIAHAIVLSYRKSKDLLETSESLQSEVVGLNKR